MKHRRIILPIMFLIACGLVIFLFTNSGNSENSTTIIGSGGTTVVPNVNDVPAAVPSPNKSERPEVPGSIPIGSVVAWLRSYTNTPALPQQWVECNGQLLNLPGSPYDGMSIPDLNGADGRQKRFLRGSTQSGAVGGAETHNHGFYLIERSAKRVINVSARNEASSLPPYYEVIWIMKVL